MNVNLRNLAGAVLVAVAVAGCTGGADGRLSGYEGEVRDGQPHGQGVKTMPDGSRYAGGWRDGKAHGRGVMTAPDGKHIEGEWRNGELIED